MSADPTTLSPIKRAFLALAEAEAKLAANEAAAREPIAVVGLGCRVPGADGPQALWQLLEQGRDAVGPIPREPREPHVFTNVHYSATADIRFGRGAMPEGAFDARRTLDELGSEIVRPQS